MSLCVCCNCEMVLTDTGNGHIHYCDDVGCARYGLLTVGSMETADKKRNQRR